MGWGIGGLDVVAVRERRGVGGKKLAVREWRGVGGNIPGIANFFYSPDNMATGRERFAGKKEGEGEGEGELCFRVHRR